MGSPVNSYGTLKCETRWVVAAVIVVVGCDGELSRDGWLRGQAVCGNGRLERPEQCDDGNPVDGDGCPSDCYFMDNPLTNGCIEHCEGVRLWYCGGSGRSELRSDDCARGTTCTTQGVGAELFCLATCEDDAPDYSCEDGKLRICYPNGTGLRVELIVACDGAGTCVEEPGCARCENEAPITGEVQQYCEDGNAVYDDGQGNVVDRDCYGDGCSNGRCQIAEPRCYRNAENTNNIALNPDTEYWSGVRFLRCSGVGGECAIVGDEAVCTNCEEGRMSVCSRGLRYFCEDGIVVYESCDEHTNCRE